MIAMSAFCAPTSRPSKRFRRARRSTRPACFPSPPRPARTVRRGPVLQPHPQPASGRRPVLRRVRRRFERPGLRAWGDRQGQPAGLRPRGGQVRQGQRELAAGGRRSPGAAHGRLAEFGRLDAGLEQHRLHPAQHVSISLLGSHEFHAGRSGRRRGPPARRRRQHRGRQDRDRRAELHASRRATISPSPFRPRCWRNRSAPRPSSPT